MAGNCFSIQMLTMVGMMMMMAVSVAAYDYGDALSKSILFFEGQRSGKLPSTQRMKWREDSGLRDGADINVDLTGGYYDAGDNVKFNFPMAFTTTMLAWSVVEFGKEMGSEQAHALEALKWGTDYFLKATSVPDKVVASVGEPNGDHSCWERPEDMDTPRTSFVVDAAKPGSEVSGEIAAALAASSIAFKSVDTQYSNLLLRRAEQVFQFADQHQGSYSKSIGSGECPFYCDYGGFKDELVWAASWLFKATNSQTYWNYVVDKRQSIDSSNSVSIEFGWDSKISGIDVLISGLVMGTNKADPFVRNADNFACSVLPESPTKSITYSPGGLMVKPGGSGVNSQHTTALSFLLLVYSGYLSKSGRSIQCGGAAFAPSKLVEATKKQVDYLLGSNPLGMSYMVGFGTKFPQNVHHRGSSLPSTVRHPDHIGCQQGFSMMQSQSPNPNLLVGAIVGGPDENDQFSDSRQNYAQTEPTTYINAPFVGVLGYFKANPRL